MVSQVMNGIIGVEINIDEEVLVRVYCIAKLNLLQYQQDSINRKII